MSVPTRDRQESKIEYLDQAVQLQKFTASILAHKFSKKFSFFGVLKTYEYAAKVAEYCIKANETDLFEYYNKRKEYLNDALANLECLSIQFTLIKEFQNEASDKQWVKAGTSINNLRKLINGVIKSDKDRYNSKN